MRVAFSDVMKVGAERAERAPRERETIGVVVSHTHWDREWYVSFERFRMRLVETVDLVLDILDDDAGFHAFMLDGQSIILEDYLEMRPEETGGIGRHVASGWLLVGPFYVLADGFLVSPETLVRNLLIGGAVARRFGEPRSARRWERRERSRWSRPGRCG